MDSSLIFLAGNVYIYTPTRKIIPIWVSWENFILDKYLNYFCFIYIYISIKYYIVRQFNGDIGLSCNATEYIILEKIKEFYKISEASSRFSFVFFLFIDLIKKNLFINLLFFQGNTNATHSFVIIRYFIRKTLLNSLDRTHAQNMFGVTSIMTDDKTLKQLLQFQFQFFNFSWSKSITTCKYSSRLSDANSSSFETIS